MTDLTLMCNRLAHADYYIEEEISIRNVRWAQLHDTPSLTDLLGLCRVKSRFTAYGLSSEAYARNNAPARNVFHVPGILTVIVYLPVPFPGGVSCLRG